MSDFSEIKNKREEIRAKWEATGILDGITGMADEKLIEFFECCTKSKLKIMLNLTEIKKDLYKSKAMANFSHYVSGNLYYTVMIGDEKFQFPISTVEEGPTVNSDESGLSMYEIETYVLSSDAEVKGSELIRWIGKALERGELIKVG